MKAMKKLLGRLAADEQGGEVIEYALVLGLIVVACITVIAAVGANVVGWWQGVLSYL